MLVEVKHWTEKLVVGDLTYYKGTLLKVTRVVVSNAGATTVKFRKVGRVKLRGYEPAA